MAEKGKRKVIGSLLIGAILITGVVAGVTCIEKIPRGYVGAIYSIRGGTSNEVLSEGWHMVSPTKKVTEYSVATEQLLLTADEREGSEENESFDATCKDGILNVDLEMSYHFNPEDIPKIAKKYRGLSGEEIMNTVIRSKTKTYLNEVTSQYTVLEAYMDKKSEINKELTEHLKEKLAPYGVVVESATIPRAQPNEAIQKAITERSKKAQEVEASKLEQEKQRVEAETKKIQAQGEAQAMIEKAEGEAKANALISQSITPNLLEKMEKEARIKHGYVTITGADSVIADARDNK